MRKAVLTGLLIFSTLGLLACEQTNQPAQINQTNVNAAVAAKSNDSSLVASSRSETQSAHSTQTAPSAANVAAPSSNSSGSRNPMERAVDTSQFDEAIVTAEKEIKQKPKDAEAKKILAEAYTGRGLALTEAAQYRAALGDFRRALKHDPTNKDARQAHDQIVGIFASLNRQAPKEGEEPAPLPFKKEA